MVYTIELEKLNETQLEAFRAIDNKAVEAELKRRLEESIYTDEENKRFQIYVDLYKAYFYLKPMYDNMRNNDVKKTITQSEILPVLEKVFRTAKAKNVEFEKYQGEPIAEPETPAIEPVTINEAPAVDEAPVVAETAPAIEPVAVETAPVVEEVKQPAPVAPVSPVTNMSPEELNKILAQIPTVTKI